MKNDPINPFEAFTVDSENSKSEPIKSFTDELLKMKGEFIEIFIGESAEQISLDQFSVPYISSIMGKLVDVIDRFLILDCLYVDKSTKELKTGNRIWLNTFQIRVFGKLDSIGSIKECFLHSKDAEHIRKLLHKKHNIK